ncbi:hypothetical protein K437DRAFT_276760 [Tilletiaria anomala UBC 951]|uniref:D-serine dehydratase-like domain-containing protein n=1 Tax=Tilletiaria anomala (strain ATCC 24038 / CBS 436.72 / UBC 951) TaxID=1037660 RepID=A0A066VDG5_TILAU|nr:uncharacterized protein K437DRAFT_276760 [Tilletiaria anomala UBC 951]KDN36640.1 hypothetical protein K437DRAFT_276760 [Tilletiaria anomala UBC 951]
MSLSVPSIQPGTPAAPRPSKAALRALFGGQPLTSLRTPAAIVDISRVRRNCARMLSAAQDVWGVEFRAHVKTHKALEASLCMLLPDPSGRPSLRTGRAIVSTLQEGWGLIEESDANDPADRGQMKRVLEEVLYSLPPAMDKLGDLLALRTALREYSAAGRKAQLRLMVDNVKQVLALEQFMSALTHDGSERTEPWSVFVKIECGGKRAGLDTTTAYFKHFIKLVDEQCPHVSIFGFYVHAGQSYASKNLEQADGFFNTEIRTADDACRMAKEVLYGAVAGSVDERHRASRHSFPFTLSVGSTPTAHAAISFEKQKVNEALAKLSGILELHGGNYPFLDLQQIATKVIPTQQQQEDCTDCSTSPSGWGAMSDVAFSILSTVIAEYPARASTSKTNKLEWHPSGHVQPGDEAMCDAGGIAMSKDQGPFGGLGHVIWPTDRIGWEISRASQEHGVLALRKGDTSKWQAEWAYPRRSSSSRSNESDAEEPKAVCIGDKIRIVPQHACLTAAQYPWYYVVDSEDETKGSTVKDVWVPWKFW